MTHGLVFVFYQAAAFFSLKPGSVHFAAIYLSLDKGNVWLDLFWEMKLVRVECVRCSWLQAETKVATIGPSRVRALPLAAGINEGGHYWSERSACANSQHLGGHYFW